MLDRVGDEVAVATSFVRYAEDSHFPAHQHDMGEEFIVLDGEFGDEHGRYPGGTYVRNPPGSQHVPFSEPGCLIWVKLRQFQPDDLTQMVVSLDHEIPATGQKLKVLHEHDDEVVAELLVAAGEQVILASRAVPQELLVLEGSVAMNDRELGRWDWFRRPVGQALDFTALAPSRLFWKTRPKRRI
jgi:hypothetical protein